jgi:hypothetical protein
LAPKLLIKCYNIDGRILINAATLAPGVGCNLASKFDGTYPFLEPWGQDKAIKFPEVPTNFYLFIIVVSH